MVQSREKSEVAGKKSEVKGNKKIIRVVQEKGNKVLSNIKKQ